MSAGDDVDFHQPDQLALAVRIGQAWIEIRRGAAMGALQKHLFGSGEDALEQGQMDTLDLLAQRCDWRMSELAEALRVDPSTATRAIQRLVNVGLASRRPCGTDGRVVMVAITRAGLDRHAEVAARRSEVMRHMLSAFTAAERSLLTELLERFVASIDDFVSTRTE